MKKIKIIYGSGTSEIQITIDKWIEDEKPEIISCSLTTDNYSNRYIAIVYDDKAEVKI
jgi:hypothetical protein